MFKVGGGAIWSSLTVDTSFKSCTVLTSISHPLPSSPNTPLLPIPQERLFSLLLTERVCPLVIKLFSPSSKYRLSSLPPGAPTMDKPTFGLSVRLLRILNILIRDFFASLVGGGGE